MNLSANKIIIAFIIKIDKTTVTRVTGNVKNTETSLKNIFNKAITTATISAVI